MKCTAFVVCLAAVVCGSSAAAAVTTRSRTQSPFVVPFAKIGRGVLNIAKAPLDVPATVIRRTRQSQGVLGFSKALVVGTAEGVVNTGARAVAGVAEVASFPLVYNSAPLYQRRLGEFAFRAKPQPLFRRKPPRR